MSNLSSKHCEACEGLTQALDKDQANLLMSQLTEWTLKDNAKMIGKAFYFKNFYETMSFVNAVAWIAHQENHHPELKLGYNYCEISLFTHAISGLSHNDFICAAKIDKLLD